MPIEIPHQFSMDSRGQPLETLDLGDSLLVKPLLSSIAGRYRITREDDPHVGVLHRVLEMPDASAHRRTFTLYPTYPGEDPRIQQVAVKIPRKDVVLSFDVNTTSNTQRLTIMPHLQPSIETTYRHGSFMQLDIYPLGKVDPIDLTDYSLSALLQQLNTILPSLSPTELAQRTMRNYTQFIDTHSSDAISSVINFISQLRSKAQDLAVDSTILSSFIDRELEGDNLGIRYALAYRAFTYFGTTNLAQMNMEQLKKIFAEVLDVELTNYAKKHEPIRLTAEELRSDRPIVRRYHSGIFVIRQDPENKQIVVNRIQIMDATGGVINVPHRITMLPEAISQEVIDQAADPTYDITQFEVPGVQIE